jgi:predicted transposase YbfD/YdcC
MLEAPGKISFLEHFSSLKDPRQLAKVTYPLSEILLLCLCAILCGANDYEEIALYGLEKLDFLRKLLPFKEGTPSHDTISDLFARLSPEAFRDCFIAWVQSLQSGIREIVAIDGKTMRHSFDESHKAIHVVSAWACQQEIVLGQEKTKEKSNEITAIPRLLDLLVLNEAIVTIDAMGCQKAIVAKIREKGADYVLSLKGNQGTLEKDVREFLDEQKKQNFRDIPVQSSKTTDAGHGRIEVRQYWTTSDTQWLQQRHPEWQDLNSIGMVQSQRTQKGKTSVETRYFISSLNGKNADEFATAIRSHWGVENKLHWIMDVTFKNDESRVRKDNSPQIFASMQQAAINLLKNATEKSSKKLKRFKASMNNDFLLKIITG